jgi:hypothetical protein
MLKVRQITQGLWAVEDTIGIFHENEIRAYLTTQRDARRLARLIEAGDEPILCCLPVAEGSPQGAPCKLDIRHRGRCRAYPEDCGM